ncbi:hypothetical protein B0H15DRAFT_795560 [Mycena belliarum]|uniref:Uncharacterized protein n=1 Tax=Mycena belliarum TaxID=1033014 RepID=A0AAD6UI95_9AGAR|nr:hypothetical protein B0H15DRAFT_795560 [Mycena belliae]
MSAVHVLDAVELACSIASATPPPLPPYSSLCPDAPLSPTQLLAVVNGNSRFLRFVTLDKHFFEPRPVNLNNNAYVYARGETLPDYDFRGVIFGEISSLPFANSTHTSFSVVYPNWQNYGWQDNIFGAYFYSQTTPLDDIIRTHSELDRAAKKTPVVRSWILGHDLLIDINDHYPFPEYITASAGEMPGVVEGPHDPRTFPYQIGDTIVAEVSIHSYQSFQNDIHRRDYALVAHRMKLVKIQTAFPEPDPVRSLLLGTLPPSICSDPQRRS